MRRAKWFAAAAALAMTAAASAAPHWVGSWAAAQQAVEPNNMLAPTELSGATLRQVVRLSIGGSGLRLVLSNTFGTSPLHLASVHIAKSLGADAIDPASDQVLTFAGKSDVTIPAGASWVSDPLAMPAAAFADLAISIQYDAAPLTETGHPGARQTSYVLAGAHAADAALNGAKAIEHWYQIAAIEVLSNAPKAAAIVALGDSITDGRGATPNANNRWTNVLAEKLAANPATRDTAVLNAGLGGNCILSQCLGPNAVSRIERDVLSPAGVKSVVVLEGVNDLGRLTINQPATPEQHAALVANMIAGYQQIVARAHTRGLKAYIATILPFSGGAYYHADAANEADRTAVNTWIRTQTLFDGVIDFDAVAKDPAHPDHLLPAYDSGDSLHPSVAGYRAMGEAAAKFLAAAAKGKK
jgi:lysophospholipase L1-like esterase